MPAIRESGDVSPGATAHAGACVPAAARLTNGTGARTGVDVVTTRDDAPHQLTQEGVESVISMVSRAPRIELPREQSALFPPAFISPRRPCHVARSTP